MEHWPESSWDRAEQEKHALVEYLRGRIDLMDINELRNAKKVIDNMEDLRAFFRVLRGYDL